jgi:flagellar hook assembly protein FlgD
VSTDVEPLAGLVPSTYELSQNYPNPFNPTTQIRFSLPRESGVKLVVFDIVGRVVTTLVDQKMSAGVHQVTWNGRDQDGRPVASGVYFYHIQAAGFSATKKMALIK